MEKNKRGQPRKASPGRAAPTPNKSTLPSQKRTKPTKNEATKVKTSTRKQKPSKPAAKSPVLSPMKTRSSPTKPTLKGKKAPDKKTTLSNKSTQNASNSKSAMKAKSPSTMPSGRKHTKKPARAIQSKLTLKRSPKHVKSASQKPLQVRPWRVSEWVIGVLHWQAGSVAPGKTMTREWVSNWCFTLTGWVCGSR